MSERLCQITGKKCLAFCRNGPCFIEQSADRISTNAILLMQDETMQAVRSDEGEARINPENRTDIYGAILKEAKTRTQPKH